MKDQNALLAILAAAPDGAPLTLEAICQALQPGVPHGPHTRLRKGIINALGRLMQKALASAHRLPRTTFGGNAVVTYSITAEGRALRQAGKPIGGGPKPGPRTSLPKPKPGMRQRLWDALRVANKATMAELVELIHRKGDADAVKVIKNGCQYFDALVRAGVVVRMAKKEKGFAPTSNGFTRYALVNNLGPIAPSAGKHFLTDHNARARIDYARKETP